ncbi:glycoside hydrolase domain-containing protein [Kitasatospora sp. NPDC086791]|uniref:glycoside hydrolase domain-containing protein n=1 Tax=Kitasatospora sp. NPDC086791 TaxID=3155178 RepID=UPI00342FA3DB
MTWGVDYPWTHPSAASLQAAGASFAMRYLSTDASKNLSRAEANDLAAHGIWCGVVWETTTGRALAGQAAGAADARTAAAQAVACGMPADRPIYFAVDTDTNWTSVQPYFAGVASVLGAARTGVYGGLRVVQGAAASGLVAWYWQTSAWSGGVWDPRAHLQQGGGITIGGVDCDRNTATTTDYGQWMPGRTPTLQEDDMPFTEDQIRTMIREEASGVDVRNANAYAITWFLQKILSGDQIPGDAWGSLPTDTRSALVSLVGDATWNHQLPNMVRQADGSWGPDGTSKQAYWWLVWQDVFQAQLLDAIKAAELTPDRLHQALADGVLRVQVTVGAASDTNTPKGTS